MCHPCFLVGWFVCFCLFVFVVCVCVCVCVCESTSPPKKKKKPTNQQQTNKQTKTEETSLHQRNNGVDSPWGILSLFTPSVRLRLNSPNQRLWWHRYVVFCGAGRFSYGVSPRTPPLEGTSLHRRNMSVERPWGILSLFTTCFQLRVNSHRQKLWHRHVCGIFVKQVVFLTWITAD